MTDSRPVALHYSKNLSNNFKDDAYDELISFDATTNSTNAESGVFREPRIPLQCRRDNPDHVVHRKRWVEELTRQLRNEGKVVTRSRILPDGIALDWIRTEREDPENSNIMSSMDIQLNGNQGQTPSRPSTAYKPKLAAHQIIDLTVASDAVETDSTTLENTPMQEPFRRSATQELRDYEDVEMELASDSESGANVVGTGQRESIVAAPPVSYSVETTKASVNRQDGEPVALQQPVEPRTPLFLEEEEQVTKSDTSSANSSPVSLEKGLQLTAATGHSGHYIAQQVTSAQVIASIQRSYSPSVPHGLPHMSPRRSGSVNENRFTLAPTRRSTYSPTSTSRAPHRRSNSPLRRHLRDFSPSRHREDPRHSHHRFRDEQRQLRDEAGLSRRSRYHNVYDRRPAYERDDAKYRRYDRYDRSASPVRDRSPRRRPPRTIPIPGSSGTRSPLRSSTYAGTRGREECRPSTSTGPIWGGPQRSLSPLPWRPAQGQLPDVNQPTTIPKESSERVQETTGPEDRHSHGNNDGPNHLVLSPPIRMQLSDEVEGAPGDDVEIVMADRPSGDEQFPIVTSRGDATKKFGKETISSSKVRTESSRSPKKSRVTTRPSKPLTVIAADGRKSSSSLSIKSLSRASTSNAGIKYGIARTVILPQQAFTRARRLLAPKSKPIVWVSMPGDVQFIDQEERSRIEHWSMPAPDKSESLHEKVSDACLVGGSKVVVAYARGSQPISILSLPKDQDASPKMHSVVHELVPSPRHESKGLLRVCAVGKRKFVTGSVDKRLFLWKLESSSAAGDLPVAIPEELEINLKASITALAYGNSRKWLITATPTRLSINSLQTGERVMYPYLENVSNLHTHGQNENLLLIERRDRDLQARVHDLRQMSDTNVTPAVSIGVTESGKLMSMQARGDWDKTLVVLPTDSNVVRVWDIRKSSTPASVHKLDHEVKHVVFLNGGRAIAATGGNFVTFLDVQG